MTRIRSDQHRLGPMQTKGPGDICAHPWTPRRANGDDYCGDCGMLVRCRHQGDGRPLPPSQRPRKATAVPATIR